MKLLSFNARYFKTVEIAVSKTVDTFAFQLPVAGCAAAATADATDSLHFVVATMLQCLAGSTSWRCAYTKSACYTTHAHGFQPC
jgi:hypothetical protein